jgi:class 3 adenylate cyclase
MGWLSFADRPGDSDDARLRKRVGIVAGYLTIIAPLAVPLQAGLQPLSVALGVGQSLFSGLNLLVLARTGRFDRYVMALIGSGAIFVPAVTMLGGGITGPTAGLEWGFLVPAYAIMALGPRRATPWFTVFVVSVLLLALVDPWVKARAGPASYQAVLVDSVLNALVPLGIVFMLLRWTDLQRRAAEARSEALLTNAIPPPIAERLKHGEDRIAEAYPATTVLFADIAGFTPWAGGTDPDRVVGLLDELFSRFDTLAAECGTEKIKTIGDAYMAVAGAPVAQADHAERALLLGRRMLRAFEEWSGSRGVDLRLRVGLASGPVVGGVIGRQRILFDLWGATVNTASRMQTHGVPGRIQLSATTWEALGRPPSFEARDIEVKGLGNVTAYLAIE